MELLSSQGLCKPERQVIGWFDIVDAAFQPDNFPVFLLQDDSGYYYGFPPYDHVGFKIGKFNHLREDTKPDELNRKVTDADEECLRECVRKYFPMASASRRQVSGPSRHVLFTRLGKTISPNPPVQRYLCHQQCVPALGSVGWRQSSPTTFQKGN